MVLDQLVRKGGVSAGTIADDSFRLQFQSGRRTFPVTLHGRILPATEGTMVSVWAFPHWFMFLWFPIWTWLLLRTDSTAWWFAVVALVGSVISYFVEVTKSYALLRRTFTA